MAVLSVGELLCMLRVFQRPSTRCAPVPSTPRVIGHSERQVITNDSDTAGIALPQLSFSEYIMAIQNRTSAYIHKIDHY